MVLGARILVSDGTPSPAALVMVMLFGTAMAYVALVDLRSRRIPNAITVPGTALALALAALEGGDALLASMSGVGLALGLTGVMYIAARGRFGMGDVKLAGLGGAVLGASVVPVYLVLTSLLAAIAAVVVLARGADRRATIAYGPYLAAGGVLCCCLIGTVVGSN